MASTFVRYFTVVSAFGAIAIASMATPPLYAQRSAAEALNKAKVLKRLAEGSPASKSAGAPSFVVDPAWPR